jgi:predicted nucleic acid-binding protein
MFGLPKAMTLEALLACRDSRRVSFVDAILWVQARHSGAHRICTFDERFPAAGVDLIRPV